MPYLDQEVSGQEPIDCRILTAALELFTSDGFHSVSVHDIQRRAGVSIGSIYNHFGGKEGIARALYHHLIGEMNRLVDRCQEESDGPRACCDLIVRRLFEYSESRRDIIAFVFHTRHREFLPAEPPICDAEPFDRIRRLVAEGMERGEIRRGDVWVASSILFGGPIRLIQLRLDGLLETPLPALLEETLATAWRALEPEEPARTEAIRQRA